MGQIAVDKDDVMGLAAITRSKQAHEFQTPGTAANHDDLRLSLSHVIPLPSRNFNLWRIRDWRMNSSQNLCATPRSGWGVWAGAGI
jgi:hypothetical protein